MSDTIWTEEENELRQIENLLNTEGKNCMNCHWSNTSKGEAITTCGHHIQNFSVNSFCAYWTSRTDRNVKAYFDKQKERLKSKLKNNPLRP